MKENKIWGFVFIGMVIVVISLLMVSFSRDMTREVKGDDPPPGTDIDIEYLDQGTPVPYSREQCYQVVQDSQTVSDLLELVPPGIEEEDPNDIVNTSEEYTVHLIRENTYCYTYWSFSMNDNYLLVNVDADSGEILYLQNTIRENGNLSMVQAEAAAPGIIEDLAPPLTGITPFKTQTQSTFTSEDEKGNTKEFDIHCLFYKRASDNVETSDGIEIDFDTSGNLLFFSKVWNLNIPDNLAPAISPTQAIQTASTYIDITNVTTTLMVVRPNYYWTEGMMRYGFEDGILCYVVHGYFDSACTNQRDGVFVDAQDSTVVGGY